MLGDRLKDAIALRGMSQGQLELKTKMLGLKVSQSYFSRLADNKQSPTWSRIVVLARALDVSLDWLAELPKRDPGILEPDEDELLRAYRAITNEEIKSFILNAARDGAKKK